MWVVRSYGVWLEFMRELVSQPSGVFPRQEIQDQLVETFGTMVAWNWEDAAGAFGLRLSTPSPGWPTAGDLEAMIAFGRRLHPLLHWYRTTGDPRPMSLGAVPDSLVPPGGREIVRELVGSHGAAQQLSIPYQLGPGYGAFVLCKDGADFDGEARQVARLVGPLLALLWQQVAAVQRAGGSTASVGAALTGREVAVLQLLAEGSTAQAIAHRLGISTRTVHSHLSHLYRKLGVADRMRAVLVARDAGLLDDTGARAREAGTRVVDWTGAPKEVSVVLGRVAHFEPGHPCVKVGPPPAAPAVLAADHPASPPLRRRPLVLSGDRSGR